jgi:hypothetical protein
VEGVQRDQRPRELTSARGPCPPTSAVFNFVHENIAEGQNDPLPETATGLTMGIANASRMHWRRSSKSSKP